MVFKRTKGKSTKIMDPTVFDELFDEFSDISEGMPITQEDIEWWLELAEISSIDIGNTFAKVAKGKEGLSAEEFRQFLNDLTQDKQIDDSQKLAILQEAFEEEPDDLEEAVEDYLYEKLSRRTCTVGVHTVTYFIVDEAVDCLLESPWAKEDENGVVYFTNRATTSKFLERLLQWKLRNCDISENDPTPKNVEKYESSEKKEEKELLQTRKWNIFAACSPITNWFAKLPMGTRVYLILTYLLWITVFTCFVVLNIFEAELSLVTIVAFVIYIFTFILWLELIACIPECNICLTSVFKVISLSCTMSFIYAFIIGLDTGCIMLIMLVCLLILHKIYQIFPYPTNMLPSSENYRVFLLPDVEVHQ